MRALVLATALVTVLAGCLRKSEKYCGLHPEECGIDASIGGTCTTRDQCAAPTPACDTASMMCVQCTANTDCMSATAPVCSPSHTCGGCRFHSDCPSDACLPDGSCAPEGDVAYVEAPTGTGGGSCDKLNACGKVMQGVASLKKVIKLTGTSDEGVVIQDRAAGLTIVGDSTARVLRSGGIVFDVSGTTRLVIAGVTIGSTLPTNSTGITLAPNSSGSVELHRVVVQNHIGGGIRVADGELRVFESSILDNFGGGVSVGLTAKKYILRNNFIIANGKATGGAIPASPYGGVLLEADAGGTFELNTVALNLSSGVRRAGVHCEGPSNLAPNNIVVGNYDAANGMTDGTQVNNTGTACQFQNTVRLGDGSSLGFAGYMATPPDLHLTAASPPTVRDAAGDCAARAPIDVDGEARPFGSACDLGADEYRPK